MRQFTSSLQTSTSLYPHEPHNFDGNLRAVGWRHGLQVIAASTSTLFFMGLFVIIITLVIVTIIIIILLLS